MTDTRADLANLEQKIERLRQAFYPQQSVAVDEIIGILAENVVMQQWMDARLMQIEWRLGGGK